MINNYTHDFHHHNFCNILLQLTLRALSYYDDNTQFIVVHTPAQLILQVQISLDRTGDFSLVTKIDRKHIKYNVVLVNPDHNDTLPIFPNTAWRYDQEDPHIYQVEKYIQFLHQYEIVDDMYDPKLSSSVGEEHEFTSDLITGFLTKVVGITTTLTVDITQYTPLSLGQAHLRI